jgi:hypothetical protein
LAALGKTDNRATRLHDCLPLIGLPTPRREDVIVAITSAQLNSTFSLLKEAQRAIETLWQNIYSGPHHRIIDGGNAIIVDVPSEHAIYYFTKPGQPMHPCVVRRTFVTNTEEISVWTEGWSFGSEASQPAFRRWLEAFQAQSAEIQARMQKKWSQRGDYYVPSDPLIAVHVRGLTSLKKDIALMVRTEGRRSFWSGFWLNVFFFVIGLAVSVVSLWKSQLLALVGVW